MSSGIRLRFSVYLLARDSAATGHALTVLEELLKIGEDERLRQLVEVTCVLDAQGESGTSVSYPDIPKAILPNKDWQMFRLDSAGAPNSMERKTGVTFRDGLTRFVDRLNRNQPSPNVPHIVMILGHGLAGYGFPIRLGPMQKEKQDETNGMVAEIGSHLEMILRAFSSEGGGALRSDSNVEIIHSLYERTYPLFYGRKGQHRLVRSKCDFLLRAETYWRKRDVFDRLGVDIVAYSPADKHFIGGDMLSIRGFSEAIQGLTAAPDNLFLHSCALGFVDSFYELRNCAASITAATTGLQGASYIYYWVKDKRDPPWNHVGCDLGKYILERDRSTSSDPRAFACVRGTCGAEAWQKLSKACQTQVGQMLKDPNATGQLLGGAVTAQGNQEVCLFNLIDFQTVFPMVSEEHDSLVMAKFKSTSNCCKTDGMGVYIPASKSGIITEYQPANSTEGFEWLSQVKWHAVLKKSTW